MKVRQLYVITILFDIDPAKNENLEFSAAVSREEFCSAVTDLEMQAARFPERR
jgi:hypothetical protein